MAVLAYSPNPLLTPPGIDSQEDAQDVKLAGTYAKSDVDSLLLGYYKSVVVATKALATAQAIGVQKKIFTVTADESQAGATKRYIYDNTGVGLVLLT